jgi:hypothetical protein
MHWHAYRRPIVAHSAPVECRQSVVVCPFYNAVPATRFKAKLALLQLLDITLQTVGSVSPEGNTFHILVKMC